MRDYSTDAERIRDIAEQRHSTIYSAAKLLYKYQAGSHMENCRRCANLLQPVYKRGQVEQCDIIGISGDQTADLDLACVCNQFKKK